MKRVVNASTKIFCVNLRSTNMKKIVSFLLLIGILFGVTACKKNKLFTGNDARLTFSADTLTFDTIFTTIGSTTAFIKVYNPYDQRLKISNIQLASGAASVFYLNVDGMQGSSFTDLELAPKDSIYIFLSCKPNASLQNQPLLISENILFSCNGNRQQVTVQAYGQDAYFHKYDEIQTTLWKNDKPHVLLGSCLVDTNQTLTIQAGTKVYCHPGAYLLVSGTLKSKGTKTDSILFRGDRLEHYYDELPGQWGGIVFLRNCASGSILEHTTLKNATTAVILGSTSNATSAAAFQFSSAPDVTIKKCRIYNCDQNGIFTFLSILHVENTLIYNCNKECVALLFGGISDFKYCTIANYSNGEIQHEDPCLRISNYAIFNGTGILSQVDATFNNCIIIGNISNKGDTYANNYEVFIDHDLGFSATAPFNYTFDHCLLQLEPTLIDMTHVISCTTNPNLNTVFSDKDNDNFALEAGSPAINTGSTSLTSIVDDLNDKTRDALPDMGCLEY